MDNFLINFHFLRPGAFLLLIVLAGLIYQLKQLSPVWGAWQKVCSAELLNYLQFNSGPTPTSQRHVWVIGIAGICIITALAGPVWRQLPQPLYQPTSALVVLMDLSLSMDAEDIKPSRLIRAKEKLIDLLNMRKEGQTALIAFAGSAHVVTPLTEDKQTILSQLQELSTDMMPVQGGNIDTALQQALKLFKQSSIQHGVVLVITDSDQFTDAVLKQLTQAGHRIDVIGIGTEQGAPIPTPTEGFVTDQQGNIVIASLRKDRLQKLAKLGHGFFHKLTLDQTDIQELLPQLKPAIFNDDVSQSKHHTYDIWHEEGPYLLFLIIPLALMGFRRGLLIVILCLGIQPQTVHAQSWDELWQTKDNLGEVLMHDKKYAQAAKVFENPAWKSSAYYKAKNYTAAEKDFHSITKPTVDDLYNHANALAHLGQLDKAILIYKKILESHPEYLDAKANEDLLEKLKKQQSSKKNNSNNQNKKDHSDHKQQAQGSKGNKKNTHDKKSSKQSAAKKNSNQQQEKSSSQHSNDSKQEKNMDDKKSSKQSASDKNSNQQHKKSSAQHPTDLKQGKHTDSSKPKQAQKGKKAVQENKNMQKHTGKKPLQHALSPDEMKKLESQQAFDQSIRRIPDDPGGLLRRKFLYQYQQQHVEKNAKGVKKW
ncbi:MAG: VWA domain-containing protein [Mariprofundaceae bacterium]|nr:VWA domain-containing protein [Mariprofundaceae bacterium]